MAGYSLAQRFIDILRGKRNLQLYNFIRFKSLWNEKHKRNNAIVVLGDSHCGFFAGNETLKLLNIINAPREVINFYDDKLPQFCTVHIGQSLAYNLNRYGSTTMTREKVDLLFNQKWFNSNAKILFSFGEIDLRVHVLRQAEKQNVSYEIIVDNVIENYLQFLLWNKNNQNHIHIVQFDQRRIIALV